MENIFSPNSSFNRLNPNAPGGREQLAKMIAQRAPDMSIYGADGRSLYGGSGQPNQVENIMMRGINMMNQRQLNPGGAIAATPPPARLQGPRPGARPFAAMMRNPFAGAPPPAISTPPAEMPQQPQQPGQNWYGQPTVSS